MHIPQNVQPQNAPTSSGTALLGPLPILQSPPTPKPPCPFITAVEESLAGPGTMEFSQSAVLYESLTRELFNPSLTTSLSTVVYTGQSPSPELFHVTLNECIRSSRENGLLPAQAIGSPAMLVIAARYPDYTNDAYALLSSIRERVSLSDRVPQSENSHSIPTQVTQQHGEREPSGERKWELVTDLILSMTLHAIAQGQSLPTARFWHPQLNQFLTGGALIASLPHDSSPLRDQTLREWILSVRAPLHFWSAVYDGLWSAPCSYRMPDIFREVRAHLEADFRNEWTEVDHIYRMTRWNCFLAHHANFPNGESIALALAHLLPVGPTDPVAANRSCFEKFTEALWFDGASTWVEKIPLSWAAALYRVYFESHKGERINNAPFRQMLLSVERYADDWEKAYPDFFNIVNNSDPVAQFKKREGEIESLLTKLVPPGMIDDPISILMTAKIMGLDFSEFTTERSVADTISSWSADIGANLITPLAPEWKESLVSVPRVKRVKESATVVSVESIMSRRLDDFEAHTRLRRKQEGEPSNLTPEELEFLSSPIAVLLTEIDSIERYFWKLHRFIDRAGNREELFSLVELLTEVCNGGANDDVTCVRDPHFLNRLRESLELKALVQAVRSEFSAHESHTNIADKKLEVAFRPTRGVLTEFVGHLCDTCFSRVSGLAKNAPWVTFVPFVKNPNASGKDGVFPAFAGGSLVIETDAICEDGTITRVLLIRGYNPSTSLLKAVHTATLFDEFSRYLLDIAKERGVSRVIVPEDSSWGLSLTNRPYAFLDIEKRFYQAPNAERLSIASPEAVALNGLVVRTGISVAKVHL